MVCDVNISMSPSFQKPMVGVYQLYFSYFVHFLCYGCGQLSPFRFSPLLLVPYSFGDHVCVSRGIQWPHG